MVFIFLRGYKIKERIIIIINTDEEERNYANRDYKVGTTERQPAAARERNCGCV